VGLLDDPTMVSEMDKLVPLRDRPSRPQGRDRRHSRRLVWDADAPPGPERLGGLLGTYCRGRRR